VDVVVGVKEEVVPSIIVTVAVVDIVAVEVGCCDD
jgi:hypothetical protein